MIRYLSPLLAVLLLGHALVQTTFWQQTRQAFEDDGRDYADRRTHYAFHDLRIDELRDKLNAVAPAELPFTVRGQAAHSDFACQRLTEGLYPRPLDWDKATMAVSLDPATGSFEIINAPAGAGHAVDPPEEFSWFYFAASLLGVVGLGLGLWLIFLRKTLREPALIAAAAPLLGGMAVAMVALGASIAQTPQGLVSLLCGLPLLMLLAAYAVRQHYYRGLGARLFESLRQRPENGILLIFFIVLLARVSQFPIAEWDGRSNFLFHSHQLHLHGMFVHKDLLNPTLFWSHTDYPVFLPAWMQFFSSLSPGFSERLAGLGLPVLFASMFTLLWIVARRRLGRLAGAAVAAAAYLDVDKITMGAYADGFLMLLLLTEFFAFGGEDESDQAIGWVAAASAAMLKMEGLWLAGAIALAFMLLRRRFRPWALLVFAPALLHRLWVGWLGISSIIKGKPVSEMLEQFWPRLQTLVGASPLLLWDRGYSEARWILWDALAGLAVGLAICAWRREIPRLAAMALALGLAFVAFAFGTISLLPESATWFVQTALDRLLLHPAALLMAFPFLALRERSPEAPAGARARRRGPPRAAASRS